MAAWDNLVLLLHCEGADEGQTFSDSSPSGHTVDVAGTDAKTDDAQAKFGGTSAFFDGDDYLSIADHSDFDFAYDEPHTVECWVYPSGVVGNQYLFEKYTAATSPGWMIYMGDQKLYGILNNTSSGGHRVTWHTSDNVLSAGSWQHIAVTYDGSGQGSSDGVIVCINGTKKTLTIGDDNIDADMNNSQPLQIGSAAGSSGFTGWMDEIAIYNNYAKYTDSFTVPTRAYRRPKSSYIRRFWSVAVPIIGGGIPLIGSIPRIG